MYSKLNGVLVYRDGNVVVDDVENSANGVIAEVEKQLKDMVEFTKKECIKKYRLNKKDLVIDRIKFKLLKSGKNNVLVDVGVFAENLLVAGVTKIVVKDLEFKLHRGSTLVSLNEKTFSNYLNLLA